MVSGAYSGLLASIGSHNCGEGCLKAIRDFSRPAYSKIRSVVNIFL